MAKIAILTDTNQPLGTPRQIPDTAIPRLRRVFGGATNTETANNVLDWITHALRLYVMEGNVAERRAAEQVTVQAALVDEGTDFELAWPQ